MYGFLYVTVNLITGQRYIGKCSYKESGTWRTYLGSGTRLKKDIEKYGRNHFFRIILKDYETEEELNKAEEDIILFFDAKNDKNFYNAANGGKYPTGIKWTEERYDAMPQKIREAFTDERKKEYSERMKANNPNKNGNSFKGKHHTEETKEYFRKMNTGKPGLKGELNPMFGKRGVLNPNYGTSRVDRRLSELQKQNMSEAKKGFGNGKNAHAVVCEETGQLYESIHLAAQAMNVDGSVMSRAVRGIKKTCKGYHWHIATDEEINEYIKQKTAVLSGE